MKKIVTVITLLLAFTISANAQDKKKLQEKEVIVLSPAEAAQKDANAITEYLGLKDNQRADFATLFQMKHEVMQDPGASMERKEEMSRIIGLKIEASIDSKQLEELKSNTTLFKQLKSENNIEIKKSK